MAFVFVALPLKISMKLATAIEGGIAGATALNLLEKTLQKIDAKLHTKKIIDIARVILRSALTPRSKGREM